MFNSIFASPKVALTLEDDRIVVHPIDRDYPTEDPTLRGTVLLTLPTRRAISKLKVVLEGLCDIHPGNGHHYETSTTIYKELVTDLKGETFDQGTHHFNFAFIVPSSTATYQRSIYGRVRHYVKATVDFEGRLSPSVSSPSTGFWITASDSPPGELPLPTDITYQHFSNDLGPVGLHVSSPYFTVSALCNLRISLLGAPQPVTITSIKGFVEQATTIHLDNGRVAKPKPSKMQLVKVDSETYGSRSSLIQTRETPPDPPLPPPPLLPTIPSLAHFRGSSASPLSLDIASTRSQSPSTPSTPQLSSSRSSSYTSSPSTPVPTTSTQSNSHTIPNDKPRIDPTPLAHLPAHTEFHYSRFCRVPDDDHCRPTTLEGSEGKIRIGHKLIVEVRYRKGGGGEDKEEEGEEMLLKIAKPLTIASCCCPIDDFYLPTYTSQPLKPTHNPSSSSSSSTSSSHPFLLPSSRQALHRCMCLLSLKEAFDRDGAALERAANMNNYSISSTSSSPSITSSPSIETRFNGFEGEVGDRNEKSPAWSPRMNERGLPTPTDEAELVLQPSSR